MRELHARLVTREAPVHLGCKARVGAAVAEQAQERTRC